ncbi:MAG: CPBP family intramembrane metalloprotease [Clostridiaceae bacterium]|nr:CPBP family intramembrane metalloprotease [Clostridiaceae bacterium]
MKNIISNKFLLCIINAIIFAFVYHSSEDFLSNLLARVPLGFALSYGRLKSNDIYLPIALHWAYNMAVTAIG